MAGAKRPRLAHLKSPARARSALVTRSLKEPQITRFGTAPDSRPGDQVAEHIGIGYTCALSTQTSYAS
jgi:hypothetical protein